MRISDHIFEIKVNIFYIRFWFFAKYLTKTLAIMKFAPYFLLCFILFSCKSKPADSTEAATASTPKQIDQWLTLKGKSDMPTIVFVSGDEEYRSEEALPQMASILNKHHGYNCTVLFAQDPAKPGIINPNYLHNIPGLEQLKTADLMVIFTRFRALPDEQMQLIDEYLKTGKPVFGIRTSTHAFNFEKIDFETKYGHYSNYYKGEDEWQDGFGRLVLGEKWINHHGHHKHQSTVGVPAPNQDKHPILNGIGPAEIWGATDVYGVRLPLPGDSQPIVLGQVTNRAGEFDKTDLLYGMRSSDTEVAGVDEKRKLKLNEPMMPVAWIKSYQIPGGQKGNVFTTTLGASSDLLTEGTRRMMVNAALWLLDKPVPAKANVNLVGDYQPTPFAFLKDDHWTNKNLAVSELKGK